MIDIVEIQKILPHRYPFLLIDRVIDIVPNESIVAIKNVTIGEQIFQGHFPSHPIYPGVMIIEGMAQAGGVLAFKSMPDEDLSDKVVYFMSIDKAKFRRPIKPGDTIVYKLSALKHRGKIWILKGEAFVDDILVAEAELQAMIMDK
ncbi:beta-hydroxyacyl-(acyl-carrier-protein) dehydratase FabZ [Campylobacter sputorum subsp. bubulus]|uniref:3-hydroxyacyl-[acyl-carrier-protein] dehydratase FabZ n=1 Tax=Campylobacter sputorum subsp. sputorum TaxID=32024 RepID=A0A381DL93_9BACT|nr:3-hydroxyacyl-ACP dehydratase FabZ [Campylobacter sputorum]ASM34660.1 3-hydroxyacyl-[acp] dehydratase [Campylobacter sputorum aubsp. sputorum RM3237]ASM36321.1 3-hydroxyacyl-[acp] dehydratase [Campylobacter sputorum bv. faecalis CCUG 20703]KAB0581126.1 3-hydroxyacyl-ACP dehydratase FabZ [Campylobacter sputorum subsp. sputorum]QEL04851.1 3-hydroxyacyl-[acp] dehydratase [Campylobacter sputorum subsp. sputorum]SUX09868.1 beta-hydroxyacyl-(acyl-carrier-protein) dehydratase FabZ [Campylobacter s